MLVVPEIAESMTQVSATDYDFKLRPGIRFHDGTEMTAEDVKFTLDRVILDGAHGRWRQTSPRQGLMGPIASVEVTAPDTVRITLKEPWPILPAMLPIPADRVEGLRREDRQRRRRHRRKRHRPVQAGRNGARAMR